MSRLYIVDRVLKLANTVLQVVFIELLWTKTIRRLVLWSSSNQISISLSPSLLIDSCRGSYIPEIDQPCPFELCLLSEGTMVAFKCTELECLRNAIIYWGKCHVPSNLLKVECENAFKRKTNHYSSISASRSKTTFSPKVKEVIFSLIGKQTSPPRIFIFVKQEKYLDVDPRKREDNI